MPPKSIETLNEILLPSIFPFLIGISPPSGPVVEPFRVAPSACKVNATGIAPIAVASDPVHLPSTSAARAGTAASISTRAARTETTVFFIFMGTPLSDVFRKRRATIVAGNYEHTSQHVQHRDELGTLRRRQR